MKKCLSLLNLVLILYSCSERNGTNSSNVKGYTIDPKNHSFYDKGYNSNKLYDSIILCEPYKLEPRKDSVSNAVWIVHSINHGSYEKAYSQIEADSIRNIKLRTENCVSWLESMKAYKLSVDEKLLVTISLIDATYPLGQRTFDRGLWKRNTIQGVFLMDTLIDSSGIINLINCYFIMGHIKDYLYEGGVSVYDKSRIEAIRPYFNWILKVTSKYPTSYRMQQIRTYCTKYMEEDTSLELAKLKDLKPDRYMFYKDYIETNKRNCYPPVNYTL